MKLGPLKRRLCSLFSRYYAYDADHKIIICCNCRYKSCKWNNETLSTLIWRDWAVSSCRQIFHKLCQCRVSHRKVLIVPEKALKVSGGIIQLESFREMNIANKVNLVLQCLLFNETILRTPDIFTKPNSFYVPYALHRYSCMPYKLAILKLESCFRISFKSWKNF